ncbi:alpha/beta hydrolase [Rhizobacter sp. AJA081-3]|uniref:alpha/beta fold hydrolase n=1 Tax=Rhizobacter sp. AJA081-3 TaxID=2753607 RepID=UPI001ADFADD6|nr:alpha/beta hydrolase [Rhizobacter sp. AJA081-3]QTN21571.1 alpha/beta hydrolase [Rhizobacter sp. AJA081-3]
MFLDVPGGKLFTSRSGPANGQAILAIGGWIGSSELWQDPLAILSDEFVVVSYDHRGTGLSTVSPEAITFDSLVADALAVLDAHGIEQCVLAAESAGAQTALAVAARYPGRVSHLVIVDGMYTRGVAVDNDPFLQGLRSNYAATLERFVQLCVPEPDSEHIKAWGRKILARAQPEAAIALRVVGSETDVGADIARVSQPTLVLHGELDKIVPLDRARELAAALPDAELVILKTSGHVPTLTEPVRIADAIRAFVRGKA